jgi:hypothetical protein
MTFLKRLFQRMRNQPVRRVRVCIECGMPVQEHREWCAILRGMQEMQKKSGQASPAGS